MTFQSLTPNQCTKLGSWQSEGDKLILALYIGKNQVDVPFAFVVNNEVIYEGESSLPLFQVLHLYQNPKEERAYIEVNEMLLEILKNNNEVEIWGRLM